MQRLTNLRLVFFQYHTHAKENILGMSDSEVILDLQQQRLRRAMGFELTNTQNIIKRSGVFEVLKR